MKFGAKVGEVAARCRQPGGSYTDDVDTDEAGRGLLTNFERPQLKKVARDLYCKTTDDIGNVDDDDDKYDKMQMSKKIIFLGIVCVTTVIVLLCSNFGNVASVDRHRISLSSSFRNLHNTTTGCRKTGSSTNEYSPVGNSVTNCDLPHGASLLGLMQLKLDGEGPRIGLVNIDEDEEQNWHQYTLGWANYQAFPFDRVESKRLRWSDFYPEWIDEQAPPQCPELPMPVTRSADSTPIVLHAVIIKLPCGKRDVGRLHIALAAAKVVSDTGGDAETMMVLAISKCRPPLKLFPCDSLLEQQDDLWLFQINLRRVRDRLAMPVGSCALSLSLDGYAQHNFPSVAAGHQSKQEQARGQLESLRPPQRREAYATLLHTDGAYVCGAVVAAQSIRMAGSHRDLIALVDKRITAKQREELELAGWTLVEIERIRNPKAEPLRYNEWNYSKFRLWQLTQYDKVVYIDTDLLVLQNLDFLFDLPEISATGNDQSLFNSGVMVIEPSNCTFNLLMDQINDIVSYNGGDQGYLNEIFPWWHRIPRSLNFFKHFWSNDAAERDEKLTLFRADNPPLLHVIHYLGLKPWLCFRDYDCNWNQAELQKYASDAAHARWWRVHDAMPARIQVPCALRTKQKAENEFQRRCAEAAGLEDEHWKINITDPRLHACSDANCDWQQMLRHWGSTCPTAVASSLNGRLNLR